MAGPPDASGCTPHRSTTPTPCATTMDVVFGHLQRRTNTGIFEGARESRALMRENQQALEIAAGIVQGT